MPYRQISRDVKLAAIRLHEQALLPLPDILDCLRISRATFYRILQLWRTTGDVVRHSSGIQGRPQSMNLDNIDYLKHLISHHADWFLDELQYLLATNRFISVHFTTIHRELGRAQVSTKKLRKIAIKRNVNLRADFIRRMAQYRPEQLGFLDEVSKDERTSARRYGRFSAEGLLTIDGMVSTTVIEGPMTRLRFLKYLEHSVVSYNRYLVHLAAFMRPFPWISQCSCDG
ncbi:hypothetical protein DFH94DRAFT_792356 [Russula ochroleuca]|uniref:Transposase n=1 Tax=Russula ochroleuca TaxID=152965 RepID=A0A9P5TBA8_9AGAM|nr:hypothetical protein DFH94DRAFT_792356 [Russula ochroleuca]